jgi:hypothetical protein
MRGIRCKNTIAEMVDGSGALFVLLFEHAASAAAATAIPRTG